MHRKIYEGSFQENDIAFSKTHDLEVLLSDCKKMIPALKHKKEELLWLTSFGVEVRYPGFNAEIGDARKAVKFMKAIRKILKGYFAP